MLGALAVAAALAGCASTPPPATIADTVARTPQLSTLSRLLADAGLTETLRGAGPYTLFAPTDEAFKAVPVKALDELGKDKVRLRQVLSHHVLPGRVPAADVKPGNLKTVGGTEVGVSRAGDFVTFDESVVTTADLPATNGVVHLIDKVIVPPAPRR
jgi:uncharacterized surface protein with fasciclin (FAS1) repeats